MLLLEAGVDKLPARSAHLLAGALLKRKTPKAHLKLLTSFTSDET